MNNIKIKLKWKLTLFTVLIMTITSGILVFSINYDVRHTVPQLKGVINSNTGDVKIDLNSDFKAEIDNISIESAIEETTSRIYWLSITTFILVVIIGGMCTYFVVNNALIPIVELNKNIKIVLTNDKVINRMFLSHQAGYSASRAENVPKIAGKVWYRRI